MTRPPSPIAQGNLAQTPLAHVLISLMRKGLSGTLAVWPEDERPGQDRILIRDGSPVAARFLDPASDLKRGLLQLFHRESSPYAFYKADLVGSKEGVVRGSIDPLALIGAALRIGVRDDTINDVIRKLGYRPQRIRHGAPLARFALEPSEAAFIDMMRAEPQTARELIQGFGDPDLARRMLYLLAITQSIEPYDRPLDNRGAHARSGSSAGDIRIPTPQPEPRISVNPGSIPPRSSSTPPFVDSGPPPRSSLSGEVVAPRSMPPPPPDHLSEEHQERWKEIKHTVLAVDRQSFYQMLGLKEADSVDDVQKKYLLLAKKWHPDRLPAELNELRPFVDEIFSWLTRARDTLVDREKRIEYQKTIIQGGGTPEAERQIEAMLEAALSFQKVDVLARRRQWDEALAILDNSIKIAPKEPDYPAMKAWILFQRHGVDNEAQLKEMNALLKRSFSLNPDHVRTHFVRANMLKRLGDHPRALQHFQKVAELDPKNLEAVREVRIAQMRVSQGRSSAPPPSHRGSGLLGKLFKKK